MMNVDVETARLINAIRVNKAIWDPKDAGYRRAASSSEAWDRVSQILFSNFHKLSLVEQRKFINKLKVKWHGLRKRFRTCINDERKSQKSGMSQNRVQIFPYRENMSFLSEQLPENMNQQFLREVNDQVDGPASASKRTAASALKNNCTSVSKRKANQKQKAPMDDFKASKKSESSNLSQFQEPTVPTSHKAESIAKLSLVSTNKNTEVRTLRSVQIPRFSCHPRPDSCEEDDEDFEFYRSLKTWTRHFNDDEKLQFRLEVMKIIDQIRTAKNDSNNFVVLSRMAI